MKKVVGLIAAAAMFAAVSSAVIAADNNPDVYVNNAKIYFADQPATIIDNRTLVPARGVFEAMGADVQWDGEARLVTIETGDGTTGIRLTIDDNNMKVYDFTSIFANALTSGGASAKADVKEIKLDVAPQIINDRTMIPLRAISEAIGARVDWNQETYMVDIKTKDEPTPEKAELLPTYFLSASADNVDEGQEFDVYINVKNLPSDTYVSAVTTTVSYMSDNFEFVSASLISDGKDIPSTVSADNPEFDNNNAVKVLYITTDIESSAKEDGTVLRMTFKSRNGKEGIFSIVNGIHTDISYNNTLIVDSTINDDEEYTFEGINLNLDTTPVIVNATE